MVAALGISALLRAQDLPSGTLVIRSSTPVKIGLNGTAVGAAGPDGDLRLQLPPGPYTVDAERPGYETRHIQVVVTAKQTTEISIELRVIPAPSPVQPKLTGRALLPQSVREEEGYGLYSYLLFGRRALFGLSKRRSRYIAAIESYLEIEEVSAVLRYAPPLNVNVTYVPVVTIPKQSGAEPILQVYDYARAQRMLSLTNIQSGDGPFIIGTRQPLSTLTSLPAEHLIQDLSAVPARIVALWVVLFMHYASRERFWERNTRDDFLLSLRTYIASGGESVKRLATSFASVVWQFNQR